jgi:hypothetical protein
MIFSTFIVSCKNVINKVEKNSEGQLLLNFEDQYPSSFFSDRIFREIEMIPLETTDDCLVGIRPELLSDADHFFIKEHQQQVILRFDRSGKFINRIGQRGGGPGEYQGDVMDFDIDPEAKIIEVMASNSQLLRYNYDGTIISNRLYGINIQSFAKAGTTYWFNLGVSKLNSDGRLLKVSDDGTVAEKFLPLKTDWFGFEDLNFTRSGDVISFKETFSHTVYRITDNGPVETTIVNFGKYALPKNVYDRDQFIVFEELNNKCWANIYKYLENEQFVYLFAIVQHNRKVTGYYHWLVNKRTGNSALQKLLPDNPLFEMMEEAKILTTDNELIFMANAPVLKKTADPFFNNVITIKNSLSEESNPVIVSLRIKDF